MIAESPSPDGRPGSLRRLPVPACEPPYDEPPAPAAEALGTVGERRPTTQGALALAFALPTGVPAVPGTSALRGAPALRLVGRAEVVLPAPRAWAGPFVQALAEALVGARPLPQLVRWTTAEVYLELQRHLRATRDCDASSRARAQVRSLHVSEPADGIAEVCALVQRGTRASAVAVRLESVEGRWKCTALALP